MLSAVESCRTFPPVATSAGAARSFTDLTLSDWQCDDLIDTARLVVSELVTNVVLHARTDAVVTLTIKPGIVRIEVADTCSAVPVMRAPRVTSGRGIAIVEGVAESFGIEHREDGKTVWAELRVRQESGPTPLTARESLGPAGGWGADRAEASCGRGTHEF